MYSSGKRNLSTVFAGEESKADASLSNTYWKAVELSGTPVKIGAGGKELHMILNETTNRVKGFSGCNSFSGGFEQKGKRLSFGPMAATRMACAEGMEQEQLFLQALGSVKKFGISGENLIFYDDTQQQLLHFTAVYLQ
ncbi:MAG: META domain-containing protein [Desulfocapsa sp.]|nr:MAG: META domain-containing protein [Desulfocapsa sp.]